MALSKNLMRTVTLSAAVLMGLSVGASSANLANANASRRHVRTSRVARTRITSEWSKSRSAHYVLNGAHGVYTKPSALRGHKTILRASKAKGMQVSARKGASLTNHVHYWQVFNNKGKALGWVNAKGVSVYRVSSHAGEVNQGLAKVEFMTHDATANNNSKEMSSARQLLDQVDHEANTRSEKNQVKSVRNNVRRLARNAKKERKQAQENALNSVPVKIAKARVLIDSAESANNQSDAHLFLDEATTTLTQAQKIVNGSKSDLAPLFNKNISAYQTEITKTRLDINAKSVKANRANAAKKAQDASAIAEAKQFTRLSQQAANQAQAILGNMINSNGTTKDNVKAVREYNAAMNKAVAYSNAAKSLNNMAQSKSAKQQVNKQVGQIIKPTIINK